MKIDVFLKFPNSLMIQDNHIVQYWLQVFDRQRYQINLMCDDDPSNLVHSKIKWTPPLPKEQLSQKYQAIYGLLGNKSNKGARILLACMLSCYEYASSDIFWNIDSDDSLYSLSPEKLGEQLITIESLCREKNLDAISQDYYNNPLYNMFVGNGFSFGVSCQKNDTKTRILKSLDNSVFDDYKSSFILDSVFIHLNRKNKIQVSSFFLDPSIFVHYRDRLYGGSMVYVYEKNKVNNLKVYPDNYRIETLEKLGNCYQKFFTIINHSNKFGISRTLKISNLIDGLYNLDIEVKSVLTNNPSHRQFRTSGKFCIHKQDNFLKIEPVSVFTNFPLYVILTSTNQIRTLILNFISVCVRGERVTSNWSAQISISSLSVVSLVEIQAANDTVDTVIFPSLTPKYISSLFIPKTDLVNFGGSQSKYKIEGIWINDENTIKIEFFETYDRVQGTGIFREKFSLILDGLLIKDKLLFCVWVKNKQLPEDNYHIIGFIHFKFENINTLKMINETKSSIIRSISCLKRIIKVSETPTDEKVIEQEI